MKKILLKCIRCGRIFGCLSSNGESQYFICADEDCGERRNNCPKNLSEVEVDITNMTCPKCVALRHPAREEEFIIHT